MASIPRDTYLDSALALRREAYTFIPTRCRRLRSDIFATRLAFQPVVCMSGPEAVAEFYVPDRFTRRGAFPPPTSRLLQDTGGVPLLDGDAHRWRKRALMSLMTPESVARLAGLYEAEWRREIAAWSRMDEVVLHDAVRAVLCRAACAWAGIPILDGDARKRAYEFGAMLDALGIFGPAMWWAQLVRVRTERWARGVIERVRAGELDAPEGTLAHTLATHRDIAGNPLDADHAANDLINVIRPTVAISRYVAFIALALHDHPREREALDPNDDAAVERFVHEVRRVSPFVPFLGGKVMEPFAWRGHGFAAGDWVLLDIYGTNRDPRTWDEPGTFRPDRFRDWPGDPVTFVPQGGGGHFEGHRCAGEWVTIALMRATVRLLAGMRYDVPTQDLTVDLSYGPAIPKSRFVITNVRER